MPAKFTNTDDIRHEVMGNPGICGTDPYLADILVAMLDHIEGLESEIQELRDDANRRTNPEDE